MFCIRGGGLRLATNRHASMAEIGISRLPSTPRRHTVEVSASLGPQQAGRIPIDAVRAVNVYQKGGPVFRLTHQGSVPLTPSDPIVYAKNLATLCSRPPQLVGISSLPGTPRQHTVEVCASPGPQQAGRTPFQCPVVGASHQCTCAISPSNRLCFLVVKTPDP